MIDTKVKDGVIPVLVVARENGFIGSNYYINSWPSVRYRTYAISSAGILPKAETVYPVDYSYRFFAYVR